jgi:recombination protein RecT
VTSEQQTTALALPDQVRSDLELQRDQLSRLLSNTIPVDRFIAVAYEIAKSPTLQRAHPASVLKAVWDAANLGLEPSGILGEGYLVTRWNRELQAHEAQFQPGYRGLAQLARRSGQITAIDWAVVFDEDEFSWAEGTSPSITHVPARTRDERSQPTHAYAWARDLHGQVYIAVLDRAEIEHVRSKSPAKNSGPWVSDWPEMAKKTAVRRLCKKLPLSPEIQRAVALDDAAELADVEEINGEQPRGTDRLRQALGVRPKAAANKTPADADDAAIPPGSQSEGIQPATEPESERQGYATAATTSPAPDSTPASGEQPEPVPGSGDEAATTPAPDSADSDAGRQEAAAVAQSGAGRCPHPPAALHATAGGVRCELCDTIVAERQAEPAKPRKARAGKAQALRTGTGQKGIVKEKAESTGAFRKRAATAPIEEQQQTVTDLFNAGLEAESAQRSEPTEPDAPRPPGWTGRIDDPFQLSEREGGGVKFVIKLDDHESAPGGKAQVFASYESLPDGMAAKSHVRLGGTLEMVPWPDGSAKPPFRRIHAESVELLP